MKLLWSKEVKEVVLFKFSVRVKSPFDDFQSAVFVTVVFPLANGLRCVRAG